MRVNRTLLYFGIFLVAIGGVVVAADLGVVDEAILADALGLWPLAVMAVGLGLILRRTRASLSGGMLAAAVPGLLLGSAFAVVPGMPNLCLPADGVPDVARREGAFNQPASILVTVDCGSLDVVTGSGTFWRLDARAAGAELGPRIVAAANALSIESTREDGWLGIEPDDWDLRLPMGEIADLTLNMNAGRGDIDLAGTEIGRLSIGANASDVDIDASAAAVTDLTVGVNFGDLSILLPAGDIRAAFEVDAGHASVCLPDGVGLRLTSSAAAGAVTVGGVERSGDAWQSPDYASATYRAELDVNVDFGALEINPIGGCR
ncbi:MAG: hypothetical protein EPO36_05300 [Chloroflexota bacterium]|nr:MAG: hypothetical protein EPO36_05300 [Chloroflexota bacterium]